MASHAPGHRGKGHRPIAAGIIVLMNDYLAGFGEWALIAQGFILLAVVVFFRRGFVGELSALELRSGALGIEIVDSEEKIQEFLKAVEGIVGAGLITMEKVQAIFYKATPPTAPDR